MSRRWVSRTRSRQRPSWIADAPELNDRDRVLRLHAYEKQRVLAMKPSERIGHEDQLFALALHASELDRRHHALVRNIRDAFAAEAHGLPPGQMRRDLFDDLERFLLTDESRDGAFLRRELLRAFQNNDRHAARLIALTLLKTDKLSGSAHRAFRP
jgi:hypothetical protein